MAGGVPDMRQGLNTLAFQAQEGYRRAPHAGVIFCFRGRRGELVKISWHNGVGMSLYLKRLEPGKFIWPASGPGEAVPISVAHLGHLLEDIDWRNPCWTQRTAKADKSPHRGVFMRFPRAAWQVSAISDATSDSGACPEFCVSVPLHAVSATQVAKRSPNIVASWLRGPNHSRTFRPFFPKLLIARSISLVAASSVGDDPRVLMDFRITRFRLSMVFVG